jgi:hypothetical protein
MSDIARRKPDRGAGDRHLAKVERSARCSDPAPDHHRADLGLAQDRMGRQVGEEGR